MLALAHASLLPIVCLSCFGCAAPEGAEAYSRPSTSARAVHGEGAASSSTLSFIAESGSEPPVAMELNVRSARVHVDADSRVLRLDGLAIALEDVSITGASGSTLLSLSGLELSLERTATLLVAGASREATVAAGQASLSLGWALRLADGTDYPLGAVRLPELEIEVALVETASRRVLLVDARCAGECFSIPGILSVREAVLHVELPARIEERTAEAR